MSNPQTTELERLAAAIADKIFFPESERRRELEILLLDFAEEIIRRAK